MELGQDVGLEKVEVILKLDLAQMFMGKLVKENHFQSWLETSWKPLLGYSPSFHLLVRGWLCFKMRSEQDGSRGLPV